MHIKAVNNDSGWLMGELLGSCLGLISQERWQRVKNSFAHAFGHATVQSYGGLVEARTARYLRDIEADSTLSRGRLMLSPAENLRLLPFWITADIIYGDLTPAMEEEMKGLLLQRDAIFKRVIQGGITRFRLSRYLPLKVNRDLSSFKNRWQRFNDRAYSQALSTSPASPIVQMYDARLRGNLEADELYQTLDEMLFANVDVTIGAMSWALLMLAVNSSVQTEVREEILAAAENSNDPHETWNQYIQSSKTLLHATVLEASRLKPLAAFSVPQAAPTERLVQGFKIPANTNFVVDTCALNFKDAFWGEDKALFNPRRFLDRNHSEFRYHYWRFGFGPRMCLGRYLADIMIRIAIVHIVRQYKVSVQKGQELGRIKGMWIAQPNVELVCEKVT